MPMILYEVTLQVEPALAQRVEEYMQQRHIPEIFATGCFRRIQFDRASAARFRTSYQANTQAELDRYLQDHASRLRVDFNAEFPAGVTLTREVWTSRKVWE
jgi:uncharacterized protein DUF4286